MNRCTRLTAVLLVLSLVVSYMPTQVSEAKPMSQVPDITAAQAKQLVAQATEKFKQKTTVGYVLEGNEFMNIYAYDSINDIGVAGEAISSEVSDPYDLGLDFVYNDWYDFKNKMQYSYMEFIEYIDGLSDGYFFKPLTGDSAENIKKSYFSEFIDLHKDGVFSESDNYEYEGLEWKASNGEAHLCYKISVPDDDPVLYDYDRYYLPKYIYIGVDDGELYSVYEEYYIGNERETVIRRYDTDFFYPQSLSIPSKFKKAGLYPYFDMTYKNILYSFTDSIVSSGKKAFAVFAPEEIIDENGEDVRIKSATIPAKIKVINKYYPVEVITYEAFYDETELSKIKLGSNLVQIDERAFAKCSKLKTIVIPDKVTYVGKRAFYECTALESVTFGKKLEKISNKVFEGCKKLKKIKVKNKKLKERLSSKQYRKKKGISDKVKIV